MNRATGDVTPNFPIDNNVHKLREEFYRPPIEFSFGAVERVLRLIKNHLILYRPVDVCEDLKKDSGKYIERKGR